MQAYIANLSEDFERPKIIDSSYHIYFSGCDFNCKHCNHRCFSEFKNEYMLLLKDLKYEIKASIGTFSSITMTGGEPCLQRQAMLDLAKFARNNNLKVIVNTHGTKPETLISLLKEGLIDEINFNMNWTFDSYKFDLVTKAATFFKPATEIIDDIKKSLKILKEHETEISINFIITIIPGLFYKKEDVLSVVDEISDIRSIIYIKPFIPNKESKLSSIIPPSESFIQKLVEMINEEFPSLIIKTQND